MNKWLALLVILGAVSANAEMYRWVDDQGRVHFSDRKPVAATQPVEKMKKVAPVNIDSSGEARQALRRVYINAQPLDNEVDEEQEEALLAQLQEECQSARTKLEQMQGRVAFFDAQKQEVRVTEQQRQEMVRELARKLEQKCDS